MDQQKCGVFGVILDKIVSDIFDSSSSDESSNDDEPVPEKLRRNETCKYFKGVDTRQGFIDILTATSSHKDFKEYFKVSRATFEFILEFLSYDLACKGTHCHIQRPHSCNIPLPPALQLLLALRKLCSSESYSEVSSIFAVREQIAKVAVYRVVHALAGRSAKFISWPQEERLRVVCQGFQASSKVPKVIGALDSTLILISSDQRSRKYFNKGRYERTGTQGQIHAVQLQVVADHEGRITFCSAGDVGKTEKQQVFDNSHLRIFVSKPMATERFPDGSHLVAGPDYELSEHVLVPYNDSNLTAEQENFNEHLKSAHNSITKAIAILKKRFPDLSSKLEVYHVDLVRSYLVACGVLHNICLENGDLQENPPYVETQEFYQVQSGTLSVASAAALHKRDLLCKQLQLEKTGVCFV